MPGLASSNPVLDKIEDVEIDSNGKYKYILCKVYLEDNHENYKLIVRGNTRGEFHSDIYDELDITLESSGVVCQCLGGGKIEHNEANKTIEVFGQSQGYGKADHHMTVNILRKKYQDYNISVLD